MIARQAIQLDHPANTPEQAILAAGNALLASDACTESYVQAMVDNFHQFGPYFVIAPGLAMPHARPEQGALTPQISFIRLRQPVAFGHSDNDPVSLVLGLSATGQDQHIQLIQQLVTLLSDEHTYHTFLHSTDAEAIFSCFTHKN
ncbi:PTS sugar transporter subunit IIA [Kosakonia sp. ML.JS2a]|uniref:PTS sugar transporter subunit IIA n=1 Tax=Kosakonia sp. ML.JS2a TaxID=2980557 RepID=UPI0021DB0C93|nr:PTS sugar transporter subunit IIA [Kosakonia sp. ML.JS2a]UXY08746.1 PTS sugar transporter subunit IIA [Kosakonia sp. ML.JS2a]